MTLTATPTYSFLQTEGQSIPLIPPVPELTVAQAAKFLDGSEGLINELLDDGLIAFRLVKGERLVQRDSLQTFAQEEERKNAVFAEMVRMNQEMGLYDD